MGILSIILIVYGVLCIFIVLLKPPFIWNMAKFKIMEKMMGKTGLQVFVLIWGAACILIGYLLQ